MSDLLKPPGSLPVANVLPPKDPPHVPNAWWDEGGPKQTPDPQLVSAIVEALRSIGLTADKVAEAIRQGTKDAILEAKD